MKKKDQKENKREKVPFSLEKDDVP